MIELFAYAGWELSSEFLFKLSPPARLYLLKYYKMLIFLYGDKVYSNTKEEYNLMKSFLNDKHFHMRLLYNAKLYGFTPESIA